VITDEAGIPVHREWYSDGFSSFTSQPQPNAASNATGVPAGKPPISFKTGSCPP
jgi:hypothetical protein